MKIKCLDHFDRLHEFEESEYIDRAGAYGIYIQNDAILLVKDALAGYWELPGGGINENETTEEGVIREFFEETGLRVTKLGKQLEYVKEYFYDVNHAEPWRSHRYFYSVESVTGNLISEGNGHDVSGAQFIPLNEIKNTRMKPTPKRIIETYILK